MSRASPSRRGAVRMAVNSLAVRIGIAFVLALLLLQGVIAVALVWPDEGPALFRVVAPAEAVSIARALESASPPQQALIVQALNHGRLVVGLRAGFPRHADRAPYLDRLFSRYAEQLEGRPFLVARLHREASGPDAGESPAGVQLLVGLNTGQVLALARAPVLLQRLVGRLSVVGGTTALILLLVMLYCVRQIARPARRLADAARRLATDIDMPDLPMRGPAEFDTLSISFNEMKQTIRGLMRERTRVLAAIAHDLRTYLTRLRLRTDFIDDIDQRQRAIHDLDEMGWLLEDTLTFARETVRPDPANTAVIDARGELQRFAATRQEIGDAVWLASMPEASIPVRCAPLALRRILSNLADNAIRYGQRARLHLAVEGGRAALVVEDDGPGVSPELLARLAQPFERGESSRGRQTGGTGLGLAIVKALAHSQGGDLVIGNRVGGGLRVTVLLPLAT